MSYNDAEILESYETEYPNKSGIDESKDGDERNEIGSYANDSTDRIRGTQWDGFKHVLCITFLK